MTLDEFLRRLKGLRRAGEGYEALCPAHTDDHPSLSIGTGRGRILVNCHAGCSSQSIVDALGLTFKDLWMENTLTEMPATADIIESTAAAVALAVEAAPRMPLGRHSDTYRYTDEEGETLFEVRRFEAHDSPGSRKQFFPYHRNAKGESVKGYGSVRRVLYRLPEVLKAVLGGRAVVLVEGEKCVKALEDIGFVATTSPGGSSAWRDEYAEALAGAKRVAILADNDAPGIKYARAAAASIKARGVRVSITMLPGLMKGQDVADFVDAHRAFGKDAVEIAGEIKLAMSDPGRAVPLEEATETGAAAPVDAPAQPDEYKLVITGADLQAAYEEYRKTGLDARSLNMQSVLELEAPYWILPGELVSLLGAEKRGKSALVQNIAVRVRNQRGEKPRILWLDTEGVGENLLWRRFMQIGGGLMRDPTDPRLLVGYHADKCDHIMDHIFFPREMPSIQGIGPLAQSLGCSMVVVDTPDGIEVPGVQTADVTRKMNTVMPGLKALARAYDLIVVAVCHVGRIASDTGKVTGTSGFGSSMIEKKSDKVLTLNGDLDSPWRTLESARARDEEPFTAYYEYEPITFRFERVSKEDIPLM